MDLERIEQALRDGPPDEPAYVPGSFRRRSHRWQYAAAAVVVVMALVTGIAIGVGFDLLRGNPVGRTPTTPITMADLDGRWLSDEISFDQWVDELVARGFDPNDIGNFLDHDPFEDSVRYQLTFDSGVVTIGADYDGTGVQVLNFGSYTVEESLFSYAESDEAPPVIGEACRVSARPRLDERTLEFSDVALAGCGVDPSIAHTAFFDLAAFARVAD